jgi:hypothetical protein
MERGVDQQCDHCFRRPTCLFCKCACRGVHASMIGTCRVAGFHRVPSVLRGVFCGLLRSFVVFRSFGVFRSFVGFVWVFVGVHLVLRWGLFVPVVPAAISTAISITVSAAVPVPVAVPLPAAIPRPDIAAWSTHFWVPWVNPKP